VRIDRWQRLEEIFHEALECAPDERAALLEAACGDDTELRRDVDSLLVAYEKETFLEEQGLPARLASALLGAAATGERGTASTLSDPAVDDTASIASSTAGRATLDDAWRPERLGPYELSEPLGRGGMGVVYRGRHTETGRLVAVKTISVPDETLVASFRREIHALARLRHPGIVRILDQGVDSGLPWYAMEVLDGTSLRAYTLAGSLDRLSSVLTLARRLCAPLAFLHGEGIVHRDLKPDNVLVLGSGVPVLVDFGLASYFAGTAGREALDVVMAGGTITYMAPEQIRGELVDARADLYAFGCVLYELLTGWPPFVGRTATELALSHLERAAGPPSEIVPGLPPALDDLVLRLLAKEPSERIGHADAVAAVLDGLGALPPPPANEPRPRAYLYRARFAGRDEALREAERHLGRLKAGAGRLLLVGGESGVGKTRLALEIARAASNAGVRVLAGEGLPNSARGGGPLEALRRPLQAIADRCRERGRHETDRLLGPRGKLLALYEPALDGLAGQDAYPNPAELTVEAARLRLFSYLAETFAALAESRPTVLILDDLQWADELALGFLGYLLRGEHLERARLLVVGTYRTEEVNEALRDLAASPRSESLDLGRLEDEAVAAMVSDMLAITPAPAALSHFLSEQSEGNPFFVTEYLRAAVEEGLLTRDAEGDWTLAERDGATSEDFERLGLPRTLRELVDRRLDGLPERAAAAVAAAAVIGRETTAEVLARTSGLGETALMEAVDELVRRHVVEEIEPERLRFAHDKLREVAYGRLGSERRARLHRAAAVALEALAPSPPPATLGLHWERAGEPAKAAGYYLAGAAQARRSYAHTESVRLSRAYLALVPEPTAESVAERNDLGVTLRLSGHAGEAAEEHRIALEESVRLGDRRAEGDSADGLGRVSCLAGQMREAHAHFEQALAAFREVRDPRREANTLGGMAVIHATEGDLERAGRLYERALAIQRDVADRDGERLTLLNLGTSLVARGRVDEGCTAYEQAVAIARETGARHGEGIALCGLADARQGQGRVREARSLLERALTVVREVGDRKFEGAILGNSATLHADEGDVERARALYDQALTANREAGSRRSDGFVLSDLSVLERRLGNLDAALRLLDEADALFREIGDRVYVGLCLCYRGHVELACGRPATEILERVRELPASLGIGPESLLGKAVSRLERAVDAAANGRPLDRGECPDDIPEGLRGKVVEFGGD
jgi:predicted ATPase/tRNA A-37 threonylcarbamoyl transferase component Bud32